MSQTQKRKSTAQLLLYVPIPIVLFSIFIFSQFKSIAQKNEDKVAQTTKAGANTNVPLGITDTRQDKLSLYSEQQKGLELNDFDKYLEDDDSTEVKQIATLPSSSRSSLNRKVSREEQLEERLASLQKTLEESERQNRDYRRMDGRSYSEQDYYRDINNTRSTDLEEIERLMAQIDTEASAAEQAEMEDVNDTMDKLLEVMAAAQALEEDGQSISDEDLENMYYNRPAKNEKPVKEEQEPLPTNPEILEVSSVVQKFDDKFADNSSNGFFELGHTNSVYHDNTFKASFFGDQTVISGSTIKIKLDEPLYVDDVIIPEDTFVYGTARIGGDRLFITINSIRYQDYIFRVSLNAYDYDGIKGINLPGSIERQYAKREASQSINDINFDNGVVLDPSFEQQAIQGAAEFGKDMLKRKVVSIRATVKSHHKILLK